MSQESYSVSIRPNGEPELYPNEELFMKQDGIDTVIDGKDFAQKGTLILTSYRILYYDAGLLKRAKALEFPHHFISSHTTSGGFLRSQKIKVFIANARKELAPFVVEYYTKIVQKPLPQCASYPLELKFKFKKGKRDEFYSSLKEVLNLKYWLIPLKKEAEKEEKQGAAHHQQQKGVMGVSGIKRAIEDKQRNDAMEISTAFTDLKVLKEKAQNLVQISEQLRSKLSKSAEEGGGNGDDYDNISAEMQEVQSVMFELGVGGTHVNKELAGKNYFRELAVELDRFLSKALERFGGLLTLIDLYCVYNRSRGTDLISPEDLYNACLCFSKLSSSSSCSVIMRKFDSGVVVVQSKDFDENTQFKKIAEMLKNKSGGMTVEEIASALKINLVLMKELIHGAENYGHVCRDESPEGVKYFENLFLLA